MTTAPLNLAVIRRDQRRVAALLGASRQLDIIQPPYSGIPFEDLYKSKFYRQLQNGGQYTQFAAQPARSLPLPQHVHKSKRRKTTTSKPAFASSSYDIPGGETRGDGRGMSFSNNMVRDNDNFLRNSSHSVDERGSFAGYDQFERTSNRKLPKSKTWPECNDHVMCNHPLASQPLSKSHPSSSLNRRQRRRELETDAPDYRLPRIRKPVMRYQHKVGDICISGQRTVLPDRSETFYDNDTSPSLPTGNSDIVPRQDRLPKTRSRDLVGGNEEVEDRFHPRLHSSQRQNIPAAATTKVYDRDETSPTLPQKYNEDDDIQGQAMHSHPTPEDNDDDNKMSPLQRIPDANIDPGGDGGGHGNPWGDAYVAALSTARARNLPRDFSDFTNRISRPYTFSYFSNATHPATCKCDNCLQKAWKINNPGNKKRKSRLKKHKPVTGMKGILGNVNINDYFKFSPATRSSHESVSSSDG